MCQGEYQREMGFDGDGGEKKLCRSCVDAAMKGRGASRGGRGVARGGGVDPVVAAVARASR